MRGLDALVGNAQVKHRLQTGRGLSHAYILAGPSGTGKADTGGSYPRHWSAPAEGSHPADTAPTAGRREQVSTRMLSVSAWMGRISAYPRFRELGRTLMSAPMKRRGRSMCWKTPRP